jgi:hypothetical protein
LLFPLPPSWPTRGSSGLGVALLLSVGVGVGACGSASGPIDADAQANSGAEVTAAGTDSPFVNDGDGDITPASDPDPGRLVRVTVEAPPEAGLAGRVIITLEDVSLSDVPSSVISRVELPAAELQTQANTVDVYLPLPLDGSVDVNAAVHVDVDESGTVSMGDWISSTLVVVSPDSTEVVVPVVAV